MSFTSFRRSGWASSLFLFLAVLTVVLVTDGAVFAQAGGEHKGAEKPSLMYHLIQSAGWVFGPLMLVVSICLVSIVVLLLLDLRLSVAIPPGFVDEFTDTVNKRRFKEAFDMARQDTSFVAKVLTAGMSRLQYGLEDAREAALNMLDTIRSDKEQKNAYLAVIGTLGPLIGLVGTVFGMIQAFIELAVKGTPDPQKLAASISQALVITLLGVSVSVPAIVFNTFCRNRITKVIMETGHIADDLLTQMYHNSKKAAAGGPTITAPAATGPATRS